MGLAWMRTAGFWPPLMLTRPTPASCEILGARRVSARSSTLVSGSVVGRQRQRQDGRVGGIGLAVNRRRGKVGRQESAGGVDGLLHLLLGHVDIEIEVELQRDDRTAIGTRRGHLLQAGHLAELAFQRRGDR